MIGLSFVLAIENQRIAVLLQNLILIRTIRIDFFTGRGIDIELAHVADFARRLQLRRMLILALELTLPYDTQHLETLETGSVEHLLNARCGLLLLLQYLLFLF